MLDGVYQTAGEGEAQFHETPPPGIAQLEALLHKIINSLMKLLTRAGHLIEEEGVVYLADTDPDNVPAPLQAASCTYCIAQGPRAERKVLSIVGFRELRVETVKVPFEKCSEDEVQLEQAAPTVPVDASQFAHTVRLTRSSLILPIARVGLSPLGQTSTQFMIEWQRNSRYGSSRLSSRSLVAWSRVSAMKR